MRLITPDDKQYKGVSLDAWPWRVSANGNRYTTLKDQVVVIVAREYSAGVKYLVRALKDTETVWRHLGTFDDEPTAKREALTLLGVGRRERRPMPRADEDAPLAPPTPVGARKITP